MFSRKFGAKFVSGLVAFGTLGYCGSSMHEKQKMLISTQEVNAQNNPPAWTRSIQCQPIKNAEHLMIAAGSANRPLAEKIAHHLGTKLGRLRVTKFPDGEFDIKFYESLRGKDVYLIQSTNPPVNNNIMELLLLISTCRRASARQVTAVMPYYAYARQDHKMSSRVPISAADVAKLLESIGVDRIITLDLHFSQIQGFFSSRIPVDNLVCFPIMNDYILANKEEFGDPENLVVVAPNGGGPSRATKFQEGLVKKGMSGIGIAIIVKQQKSIHHIEEMEIVGSITGKNCILVDDIITTGNTVTESVKVLKKNGAKKIYVFATHGVFSGEAYALLNAAQIDRIVVTNSVVLKPGAPENMVQLDVAVMLAEAIRRIEQKESLSPMFPI